jgi:hypothetical protein
MGLLLLLGGSTITSTSGGEVDGNDVVDVAGEDKGKLCEGITCKEKPLVGSCVGRSALTLSATAAYGAKRVCCEVWACSHTNGSTTLHYGTGGGGWG